MNIDELYHNAYREMGYDLGEVYKKFLNQDYKDFKVLPFMSRANHVYQVVSSLVSNKGVAREFSKELIKSFTTISEISKEEELSTIYNELLKLNNNPSYAISQLEKMLRQGYLSPDQKGNSLAKAIVEARQLLSKGSGSYDEINLPSNHREATDVLSNILKTSHKARSEVGESYNEIIQNVLNDSLDSLVAGKIKASTSQINFAKKLLDIGLGVIPVFSEAKDLYEAITGKSAISGDILSDNERLISLASFSIGAVTLGGATVLKTIFRAAGDLKVTKTIISKVAEIVEASFQIGVKSRSEVTAAVHVSESASIIKKAIIDNRGVIKSWKKNHIIKKVLDSEVVNSRLLKMGYGKPPFKSGTKVIEFVTNNSEKFVRVITENGNPRGRWIMKKEAIKGLSPAAIAKKYSLPSVPTHILDVGIDKGVHLARGRGAKLFGGSEGSVQYFVTQNDLSVINYSEPSLIDGVVR